MLETLTTHICDACALLETPFTAHRRRTSPCHFGRRRARQPTPLQVRRARACNRAHLDATQQRAQIVIGNVSLSAALRSRSEAEKESSTHQKAGAGAHKPPLRAPAPGRSAAKMVVLAASIVTKTGKGERREEGSRGGGRCSEQQRERGRSPSHRPVLCPCGPPYTPTTHSLGVAAVHGHEPDTHRGPARRLPQAGVGGQAAHLCGD